MKPLILSLLACFTILQTHASANDTLNKKQPFKRVMIGVSFAPDVTYRILFRQVKDEPFGLIIDERNKIEIPKFGYNAGLHVLFNFKSFVGVEAGLWYLNTGEQTRNRKLYAGYSWNGSAFVPTDSIYAKFVHDYHYVGIPLKAKFTVGKGKIRFFAATGIAVNFLISNQSRSTIKVNGEVRKSKSTDNITDFRLLGIMPLAEAGLDWKINHRMNLSVCPSFRFNVLSITKSNVPVSAYYFNAGISTRFYFGI